MKSEKRKPNKPDVEVPCLMISNSKSEEEGDHIILMYNKQARVGSGVIIWTVPNSSANIGSHYVNLPLDEYDPYDGEIVLSN